MADCARCGANVPKRAQFCPACGLRVGDDPTTAQTLPPHETTAAPMTVAWSTPRYFGLTPPMLLFGVAAVALAVAVALAILEHWVGALVLAVVSLICLALFVGVARRKPDALTQKSVRAIDRVRDRASWAMEALTIRSSSHRELTRLRYELVQAAERRESLLRQLGAAVYARDRAATEALTQEIAQLDDENAQKELDMNAIATEAEQRIAQGRLRVQPTMIEHAVPPADTEPAQTPLPPEPAPPPDEGTPPTPAPVPEPYPPPDEGTPPTPEPVPEPTPAPEPDIRAK